MKLSTLITRDNWQEAVVRVVANLPEDIQGSVGHAATSPRIMHVRVAVEPIGGDLEAEVCQIELRLWDTMREQLDEAIRDTPSVQYIADCYPAEDPRWGWPLLAVTDPVN